MHLRAIEPSDYEALNALSTEPSVARTLGGTPCDYAESMRERLANRAYDRSVLIGAFEREKLVGAAELDLAHQQRRKHAARLWVAVAPAHQGKGVGNALVGALVDAADKWLGLTRIELGVHTDHTPAIKLYEKHGFVIEVTSPAKMLRDGALVAAYEMARIRPGFVSPHPIGEAPPMAAKGERARVRIRPRVEADAAMLRHLHANESVIDGTFQLPFQPVSMWEQRLQSPPPGSHMFVAELDELVVGSVMLNKLGSGPRLAHVMGLGMCVAPEAQGRGVGDALMTAALELADKWLGLRRVELTLWADNERARRLYERHGFALEGTMRAHGLRRGGYPDALAMGRVIDAPRAEAYPSRVKGASV